MPSLVQYTCALLVVHQVEICITAAKSGVHIHNEGVDI